MKRFTKEWYKCLLEEIRDLIMCSLFYEHSIVDLREFENYVKKRLENAKDN